MNQNLANVGDRSVKNKICPKCNQIIETDVRDCRQCGKKLMTVSRLRILGVILLIIGLFLFGMMSWLSWWMYQTVKHSGEPGAARFTGSPEMIQFIIILFGLLLTFSMFAIVSGSWQIIFGRRNKILNGAVLLLGIGIAAIVFFFNYTHR